MSKFMKYLFSVSAFIPMQFIYADESSLSIVAFNAQQFVVFTPKHLSQLTMTLNNAQGKALKTFSGWKKELNPSCDNLIFAMNAGMYHADFSPVGLYVEHAKEYRGINLQSGLGNFFLKPNGVLAWNQYEAKITTTTAWLKHDFKPQFATQSGPMLVINQKISPIFLPDSNSRKVRNGVGIRNGQLYFVISQNKITFYEFARFFRDQLRVEQALYLDGSISSIYAPSIKRHDHLFKLGPMLGYIQHQPKC